MSNVTMTAKQAKRHAAFRAAFTEWMRRYRADPEAFAREFGEAGDYGTSAATYFCKLLDEQPPEMTENLR